MKVSLLSSEVVSKLRSGIAIISCAHCVEELVLNAIDAGATCIAVRLNLPFFKIQVIDNGEGISVDQLELIGERYATSKCHSLEDLKNLRYGGFRGEALSSLREISSVVEIVSRSAASTETYCKMFNRGQASKVTKSVTARPSKGTTVTILDFMYNMPIRRKNISEALDLEQCRRCVESILLMHPHISFTLRNDATGEMYLQTRKCQSVITAFTQLFGLVKAKNLKEILHFDGVKYKISGYISTEGHISKDMQFMYINKRRVLKTKLNKLINVMLSKALFLKPKGGAKDISSISTQIVTSSSPSKSQVRYSIFVVNISCPYDEYDIILEPRKTIVEFENWDHMIKFVEEAVINFLKKHSLLHSPVNNEFHLSSDQPMAKEVTNDSHKKNRTDNYGKDINVQNTKHGLFSLAAKRFPHEKIPDSLSKDSRSCDESPYTVSKASYDFTPEAVLVIKDSPLNAPETSNAKITENGPECTKGKNIFNIDERNIHSLHFEPNSKSFVSQTNSHIQHFDAIPTDVCKVTRLKNKNDIKETPKGQNISISNNQWTKCINLGRDDAKKYTLCNNTLDSFKKYHDQRVEKKLKKNSIPENANKDSDTEVDIPNPSVFPVKNPVMLRVPVQSSLSLLAKRTKKTKKLNELKEKFQFRMQKTNRKLRSRLKSSDTADEILNDFRNAMDNSKLLNNELFPTESHSVEKLDKRITISCNLDNVCVSNVISEGNTSKKLDEMCLLDSVEIGNNDDDNFSDKKKSTVRDVNHKREEYKVMKQQQSHFHFTKNDFVEANQIKCGAEKNRSNENCCIQNSNETNVSHNEKNNVLTFETMTACDFVMHGSKNKTEANAVQNYSSSGKDIHLVKTVLTSSELLLNRNKMLVSQEIPNNLSTKISKRIFQHPSDIKSKEKRKANSCINTIAPETISVPDKKLKMCEDTEQSPYHDFTQSFEIRQPCTVLGNVENMASDPTNEALDRDHINISQDHICFECLDNSRTIDKDAKNNANKILNSFIFTEKQSKSKAAYVSVKESDKKIYLEDQEEMNDNKGLPHTNEDRCSVSSQMLISTSEVWDEEPKGDSKILQTEELSGISELITKSIELFSFESNKSNEENASLLTSINISRQKVLNENISQHLDVSLQTENINCESNFLDAGFKASQYVVEAINDSNCKTLTLNHLEEKNIEEEMQKFSAVEAEDVKLEATSLESCSNQTKEVNNETEIVLDDKHIDDTSMNSKAENDSLIASNSVSLFPSNMEDKRANVNNQSLCMSVEEAFTMSDEVLKSQQGSMLFEKRNLFPENEIEGGTKELQNLRWVCKKDPITNRDVYFDSVTGNSSLICPTINPPYQAYEYEKNVQVATDTEGQICMSHFFLSHNATPMMPRPPGLRKNRKSLGIFKAAAVSGTDSTEMKSSLQSFMEKQEAAGLSKKWKVDKPSSKSSSVEEMFSNWENPMFQNNIPKTSTTAGTIGRFQNHLQMHTTLNSYRFTKAVFSRLQVIGQVDCKFLACIVQDINETNKDKSLLVLFDQHAVHERVRLEQLMEDLYEVDKYGQKTIKTSSLTPPLELHINQEDLRLLKVYHGRLAHLGITLSFGSTESQILEVHTVPACLLEREASEMKRKRQSVTAAIVENILKEWLLILEQTRTASVALPKTLINVLNSQACHGAIRFGDPLELSECEQLLKSLSSCKLPFQCAHGRPSLAPILDLQKLAKMNEKKSKPQLWKISKKINV